MALVNKIKHQILEWDSTHSAVECTYDVVIDKEGRRYLQLDTFGSQEREMKGKRVKVFGFLQKLLRSLN